MLKWFFHRKLRAFSGLARLLADDAVWYSDGGGKRVSALKPVVGKDRILRFYEGIWAKGASAFGALRAQPVTLNGLPGFVFETADGTETLAIETANGLVVALYAVRNPDKVRHLA